MKLVQSGMILKLNSLPIHRESVLKKCMGRKLLATAGPYSLVPILNSSEWDDVLDAEEYFLCVYMKIRAAMRTWPVNGGEGYGLRQFPRIANCDLACYEI